jgi:benzoyl-CoA 2,3-dioxygenase component B
MLKEEAHHMFVGNSGISRIVARTAQLMRDHDTDDVRPYGAFDLSLLQRYLNFHYAVSLDLFGSEASTNAASYYSAGLKGRMNEDRYDDDHVLRDGELTLDVMEDGQLRAKTFPALNVVNQMLRLDYAEDCQKGVDRWNRVLEEAGIDFRFRLPHQGFHRQVGFYAGAPIDPDGVLLDDDTFAARKAGWLPTDDDRSFVAGVMEPCYEPGHVAGWIGAPTQGINGRPVDYDYVRL